MYSPYPPAPLRDTHVWWLLLERTVDHSHYVQVRQVEVVAKLCELTLTAVRLLVVVISTSQDSSFASDLVYCRIGRCPSGF